MQTRMRDLEQIQERDSQDGGRRVGTLVMASLTLVGLTFAMGVVIGQAAEPGAAEVAPDPLAALDQLAKAPRAETKADRAPEEHVDPRVEARDLSFPTTLTGGEERPEVLAAIAAAAEEEERLLNLGAPSVAAAAIETSASTAPTPVTAPADDLSATLPAAVAAGRSRRSIMDSVGRDPMVANSLPRPTSDAIAPRGSEGEFTLQVISYDQLAAANEFAEALRARGHQAFVVTADVPDRGRFYRVRIGPFATKHKADAYRAKFEAEERMNTFVIKRPRDQSAGA